MRVGTSVRVAAAAGALALVGTVLLAAPPAWATVTTYTWTGTDAASTTTPNPAWSDPANWGGTAPPAGSAVDLAFPASVCASGSNACNGVDDISGLVADTVTIGTPSAPSGSQPPPGYQMSAASSQTLTLDGGFNLTGAPSATSNFSVDVFAIPVVLGAPNTWSLAGPSNLILPSGLSGTSQSLQMNMSQSAIVTLSGTTNEVGPVDVTGANTSATGYSANENGTLFVNSDLNGTDLSPVTAANVAVTSLGAPMGPLSVSGGWLALVTPSAGSPGGTGVTAVQGNLSFDSGTVVQYQSLSAPSSPPTPGTDYPQITSPGAATLGGAQLSVMADCGMADGISFTLVSAGSVSGTFDHFAGNGASPTPITDGEVIQADPGAGCNGSPGPYLRINYTATTVTATVVPQPTTTTTLSASPASPQVNEAYQLVATVTPSPAGSSVPDGYVAFSVNGSTVSSCAGQPVQAVTSGTATTYQATCDMPAPAAPASDSDSDSATYSGDQILQGSTGAATITVAKGSTSTALGASTTTAYEGQTVTYTATVSPAAPSGSTPTQPTGDVEFFDGTTPITGCTSQPLSSPGLQATCAQTYSAAGSHSVTAEYLGDANFDSSTSGPVAVTVQAPATSSTSVSFSPAPTSTSPVVGQSFTATATVTSSATPAGTVSFYADGATSPVSSACTSVPLSTSSPYTASCSMSFASAGSHSVTAVYTSSSAGVSGSSGTASLTVQPAPAPPQKTATSTAAAASPASPTVGQAVTYTATVSSASGTGTPSGTVAWSDGGTPISGCTATTLDGASPDTATCTVTYDATGSHQVTAAYQGDANFAGSVSSPVTVTVGPAPGTTSSQSATSTTPGGSATATDDQVTADATGGEGTVTVSQYASDPVGPPAFQASGNYFDVSLSPGATFTAVTIADCNLAGTTTMYWWDPASGPSGAWLPVKGDPGPTYSAGPPACLTVTLDATTSPDLTQLGGTVFTTGTPVTSPPPSGYWLPAADGAVFAFGAPFHGSPGGLPLAAPVVGMAPDRCTGGYWLAGSDGGVFNYDAPLYGSLGGVRLAKAIVGIAPYVRYGPGGQPLSCGYWLVASDGGVFAFNAPFRGSLGGMALARPVVGMAADAATGGYWLVASDGGVFAFDAPFRGSLGGMALARPVVGMAADAATGGYWLVASDGGVFAFDAPFQGSMGDIALTSPVVGITAAGG